MNGQTEKQTLLVLVGPTASGKTGLAVALAKRLKGEVISADSMQVYKQMEIGTAKPTAQEMDGVPHHLIDFLEPEDDAFSVADYARRARKSIVDVAARGKLPIVAGGTGLYISALVDGIDFAPISADPVVRAALAQEYAQVGGEDMFNRLRMIDPETAARLHPNNQGRVLRALEVYKLTGIPMSEHQRRSRRKEPDYRLCMLGLDCRDRAVLYERINRRVDLMLERGLLEEAARFAHTRCATARQAIGYKELKPYLDGAISLERAVELLKQATRRYAKRQLTWFRRDERIQWLYLEDYPNMENLIETAQALVHKRTLL